MHLTIKRYVSTPTLKGAQIDTLTSDVDITPTILDLLEVKGEENGFMGVNAFRRNEPIIVKWGKRFVNLTNDGLETTAHTPEVSPFWNREKELIWTGLNKFRFGSDQIPQ